MSKQLEDWPDCPIDGCPNKICLALDSDRCFPHTPGNRYVKGWKIDALHGDQLINAALGKEGS